jgi:hypothetical protein
VNDRATRVVTYLSCSARSGCCRSVCAWLVASGTIALQSCGPAMAQVALSTNTSFGVVSLGFETLKSVDVGALDVYVAPELSRSMGGGSSRSNHVTTSPGSFQRPSLFRIILPDGKLPTDFSWRYASLPGWRLRLALQTDALPWPLPGGTVVSVFVQHDYHRVRFRAPSGFGILVDPTSAVGKVNQLGAGAEFLLPMLTAETFGSRHRWHLGGGILAYRTHTTLSATSAFLDLEVTERRHRLTGFVAAQYSFRKTSSWNLPKGLHWDGIDVRIQAYPTDHLWAASASVVTTFSF